MNLEMHIFWNLKTMDVAFTPGMFIFVFYFNSSENIADNVKLELLS